MANSVFVSPNSFTNTGTAILVPVGLGSTVEVDALATTSTDGLVAQNTTAATAGATVQQSPRIRLRSNVWNSTATAATNTNDFYFESVPVTGATPSGLLKVLSSLNGAASTIPLTLSSAGTVNALLGYQVNGVAGVGFAMTTAQPANQTGNATGTLKMNGLGAAAAPATITPTSSGRVIFIVTGNVTNSTILDGVQLILVYGTGAAPANAAAATGTVISATQAPAAPVAAQNQGFSIIGSATGLALNTAVWFDLQISNLTGGTASVSNVTCVAYEI